MKRINRRSAMDIYAAIQQVAEACGVSTPAVGTFAQLTVTPYRKGLEGTAAIQAASDTYIELANRALQLRAEFAETI